MVYTVTLNPALDYVMRLEALHPGETNRTGWEELQSGGKGINVSFVLKALGVESTALGFVAGFTGRALEEDVRARGLQTRFVHLEKGLTRINVKLKADRETEINARGPEIPPRAVEQLLDGLDALGEGDVLVLSGSAPASLGGEIYGRILERTDGRGVLCAVDAGGELLRQALPHRPFLIKPNRDELEELFGRKVRGDEELWDCARALQEQGARNVLVSLAGEGSALLDETGRRHRLDAAKGRVVNSVGAGDSMVAGFLAGWLKERDYAAAHRLASAAGSATAFSEALAARDEILALLERE